jgi:hypothetical protein
LLRDDPFDVAVAGNTRDLDGCRGDRVVSGPLLRPAQFGSPGKLPGNISQRTILAQGQLHA